MSEEKKMEGRPADAIIAMLQDLRAHSNLDGMLLSGTEWETLIDEIERLRRSPPSPSGRDYPETKHERDCLYVTSGDPKPCTCKAGKFAARMQDDLGSPQAGLGGPSSTPSDALEAAQRIVDFNPLHGDWDDAMCEDAEAVARALLAASPSPWRSMEWRTDMENAPHDEALLVYGNWEGEISYKSKGPVWCVASSANGTYWRAVNADYYSVCCIDATRWMPLPSNKAEGSPTSSPEGEAGGTTFTRITKEKNDGP